MPPGPLPSDGQLIAAAHAGDADAWRELYQRWLPWVWRAAYAQVQDTHAAEDITSEAMTAWVRRLGESGGDAAQLAAWLRTVVRNKAADHHRHAGRARRAMQEVSARVADNPPGDDPAAPSQTLEARDHVNAALGRLPENYRLALEWKYQQSLSVQAIAERMGVTEKSVEAVLYRARKEFRRHYELIEAQQNHHPAAALSEEPTAVSRSPHQSQ